MYKKMGAIFLVAGTCIGSGMIALPMVLAKLGLIPSVLLMLGTWFIMYYTSLVNLELNLQAGMGLSLGTLGRLFSGRKAEMLGTLSLKLLSYSLLAVFIYGGSSILQELIANKMQVEFAFTTIATLYAFFAALFLLLPIKLIDYCNRFLFITLFIVVIVLIAALGLSIEWSHLPLYGNDYQDPLAWFAVIPIVFTSFGFQVIFHTLTNYCNKNAKMLKSVFFLGSLIPACIYILWTCTILSAIYHDNSAFYQQMTNGNIEVGELIEALGHIAKGHSVQLLVWWISSLAIATSVIGVGVGLYDSIHHMIVKSAPHLKFSNLLAVLLTIFPAYLVVIFVPNAFITVLGFAGMILALIAILLPVYLFSQIKSDQLYFEELKSKTLIYLSVAVAILVIAAELWNIF